MAAAAPPLSLTPRDLFPWLCAGVSLQLRDPAAGAAGEEGGGGGADPVFLIVSDKSFRASVMFRDRRRTTDISPFLIRSAQAVPGGDGGGGCGLVIRHGSRFTLNELRKADSIVTRS